jgi:general bacterial porin, GBP family
MKKYLSVAVPLVAACGAASAQSSVNVYALLDLNVSYYSSGSRANAGSVWKMMDGTANGLNGSRLGFRGTEDLGGGLAAGFVAEMGLDASTGALGQGGRGFGRQVFASLKQTNLGELRFGRQYILSDHLVGQGNPFSNALVNNPTTSVTNMGRNLPMFLNAPRADNVVQYALPTFGGVSLAGQIAPGEGTADRFHGLRAAYAQGPVYVGVAYEWNKSRVTGDDTNKSLSMSANYNFGVVKLLGEIQRNSDVTTTSGNGAAVGVSNLIVTGPTTFTAQDINGWSLGAEIPAGSQLVIGANYTKMTYESAGGASSNLGKVALTGRYGLSKNTFLYAGGSQAVGDLKDYISEKRVLQAGIRTAF